MLKALRSFYALLCRTALRRIWLAGALAVAALPATGQIIAPAGRTLFNRAVMVRNVLRYDTFDEARTDQERSRWRNNTAVVWGARPHLSLSAVLPLVRTVDRDASSNTSITRTGSADATFFARYDLVRRTVPRGYTRLAPELGLKLPTGGAFGNGSTDVLAGLVLSHVRDPSWLVADVQLTRSGTGDGGLRAGDRWRFDLAYLHRVLPRRGPGTPMLLLVLEVNGESAAPARRDGASVAASGGDVWFVSPGVELILNRHLVLELAAPVAISANLGDGRPEPDSSLVVGVRWLF